MEERNFRKIRSRAFSNGFRFVIQNEMEMPSMKQPGRVKNQSCFAHKMHKIIVFLSRVSAFEFQSLICFNFVILHKVCVCVKMLALQNDYMSACLYLNDLACAVPFCFPLYD